MNTWVENSNIFRADCYSENKTQGEMCLEYLERFGSITPLEALYGFGSMRLSAQICNLRKRGYDIETEINKGKKHYAIYKLLG